MSSRPEAPRLPLPPGFDPARAADRSYRADTGRVFEAASAWRRLHSIRPAAEDRSTTRLLLVDVQKDFCFPDGALHVGGRSGRGALEDSERICRFILENLARITGITCTLDTHHPHQIFFPSFWVDRDGRPLPPHREVRADDVRRGDARPGPAAARASGRERAWLEKYAEHYCDSLELSGKYRLYLWPFHCLLGSDGHGLVGAVDEARLFHALARDAPGEIVLKGSDPLTESYSALAPEVLAAHDGAPVGRRNERLVDDLLVADRLIVAGQAASHCVRYTLEDLLGEIRRRDERLAGKVYILEDCMSSVAVPDPAGPGRFLFDFTDAARAALDGFRAAGMRVVSSGTPMEEWPG
jgi:nicotinamidase-related amidase